MFQSENLLNVYSNESNCPLLDKYQGIPHMARWKALIIEHGVTFDNPDMFTSYPEISRYKTKKRILRPTREGSVVTDTSTDRSIIPSEILISHREKTSIVKLGYREGSPIEMRVDSSMVITLNDRLHGAQIPIDVRLVERNPYTDQHVPEDIDPGKHVLDDFIGLVGMDRLSIMPFDGCWNWNSGSPCSFCDYNPKSADFDTARPLTNTLKEFGLDIQKWWERSKEVYLRGLSYTFGYIKEFGNIGPHKHLLLMSGNLPESKFVWQIAEEVVDTLNPVDPISGYDTYLNICPHPDISQLIIMKEKGVKQVQYNLEVIGSEQFKTFCPGKLPYDVFRQKLIEAVDVMGPGNVRSNFALGLQPVEELFEGVSEPAKQGVVADYSILQPKKSTPLEHHESPSMDEIVLFTTKLAALYRSYGFQPIYCPLSSRSSIINETL